MMKNKVYFAGAGGIGMAALERYFLSKGCLVAGYDKTPSALTDALQKDGVEITFDESVDAIPEEFRNCPDEAQIVYTPALPDNHPQLVYFRTNGYEVVKRAKVLGDITRGTRGSVLPEPMARTTTRPWLPIYFIHVLSGVMRFLAAFCVIMTAICCSVRHRRIL